MSLISNVNCNCGSGLGCCVNQNGTAGSTNHVLQRSAPGVYTPSILSALLQRILLCPFPLFSPVGPGNLGRLLVFELGCWQETPPEKEGIHPRAEISSAAVFLVKHKVSGKEQEIRRRLNQDGLVRACFCSRGHGCEVPWLSGPKKTRQIRSRNGVGGALLRPRHFARDFKGGRVGPLEANPPLFSYVAVVMFSARSRDDTKEWQKVIGRMK